MNITEGLLLNLVTNIEKITSQNATFVSEQQQLTRNLSESIRSYKKNVADELFSIANDLNKSGLSEYGVKIESIIVNSYLDTPYDAISAFNTHKALFTDRHEMAIFLHKNLEYLKNMVNKRLSTKSSERSAKPKVFTYWHSNENLPKIVELCRNSLRKYVSNKFELIILTEENYSEWIEIDKNIIPSDVSQAHFSDLLRVKLLNKWGGFWIDATCLLSQDLYEATKIIREQDLFYFTYIRSRIGSWFIWSQSNTYELTFIELAFELWWKKKKKLTNYFMFHDIVEMLYWVDNEYRKRWDNMIKIHPKKALEILRSYKKEFTQATFTEMLTNSFIHKLSYKNNEKEKTDDNIIGHLLKL